MLLALCFACVGCAHQTYPIGDAAETSELKIRAGDEIRLVTTDRERLSLRVGEILEDRITGITLEPARKEKLPGETPIEVPYTKIAMIQVTRFDAKAAGVVAVFTVVLGALVLSGVPVMPP